MKFRWLNWLPLAWESLCLDLIVFLSECGGWHSCSPVGSHSELVPSVGFCHTPDAFSPDSGRVCRMVGLSTKSERFLPTLDIWVYICTCSECAWLGFPTLRDSGVLPWVPGQPLAVISHLLKELQERSGQGGGLSGAYYFHRYGVIRASGLHS